MAPNEKLVFEIFKSIEQILLANPRMLEPISFYIPSGSVAKKAPPENGYVVVANGTNAVWFPSRGWVIIVGLYPILPPILKAKLFNRGRFAIEEFRQGKKSNTEVIEAVLQDTGLAMTKLLKRAEQEQQIPQKLKDSLIGLQKEIELFIST